MELIKCKKQLVRRSVAKVDATVCVGLLDKMNVQVCFSERFGLNCGIQCRVI